MKILMLNAILSTAHNDVIQRTATIKDAISYDKCLGFRKLGHDVTLIAADDYRPTQPEGYEFEVIFMKSSIKRIFKPSVLPYLPGLRRFLKKRGGEFDLIITSELFSLLTLEAVRLFPEKTVITQELNVHQKRFRKIPSKLWHTIVVRHLFCKKAVLISYSPSAQSFSKQYFANVSDEIIEHGINPDKFECAADKKRQIISSSQLIPRKRVDRIIRKFADLHSRKGYSDIRLLIAGRGPEEKSLKSLTAELGLSECVDFLGFLPHKELTTAIKESMCFCIDTAQDLNMISVSESIMSGTPVLMTTVPASVWYVRKYQLGIADDNWTADDLQHVIDDNPRYIANCVGYRHNLFSEQVAQKIIDLHLNREASLKQHN